MRQRKKHHELIKNCPADQRRKSKSSSLQQQWHMVVSLHRTPSGLHQTSKPDVLANAQPCSSESETRPLVLGIRKWSSAMKTDISVTEERQFITKEFADTIAG